MSFDDFDFKQTVYLGERISKKHPFFCEISKLGFDEAENYALLAAMKALFPEWNEIAEGMQALVELVGMASFLRATKEITRLSLILGDTQKVVSATEW